MRKLFEAIGRRRLAFALVLVALAGGVAAAALGDPARVVPDDRVGCSAPALAAGGAHPIGAHTTEDPNTASTSGPR